MAQCDECGCYNDDHFDGTVTEEEFDNNPLYFYSGYLIIKLWKSYFYVYFTSRRPLTNNL